MIDKIKGFIIFKVLPYIKRDYRGKLKQKAQANPRHKTLVKVANEGYSYNLFLYLKKCMNCCFHLTYHHSGHTDFLHSPSSE